MLVVVVVAGREERLGRLPEPDRFLLDKESTLLLFPFSFSGRTGSGFGASPDDDGGEEAGEAVISLFPSSRTGGEFVVFLLGSSLSLPWLSPASFLACRICTSSSAISAWTLRSCGIGPWTTLAKDVWAARRDRGTSTPYQFRGFGGVLLFAFAFGSSVWWLDEAGELADDGIAVNFVADKEWIVADAFELNIAGGPVEDFEGFSTVVFAGEGVLETASNGDPAGVCCSPV